MDWKKIRKIPSRLLGRWGLVICSFLTKLIPASGLYGFAEAISWLVYHVAAKQRKIALESLSFAFGKERSGEEIQQIARDCFTYIAKSGVELVFFLDQPELFKRKISISGEDFLKEALSAGKGVILVSAHFGNFPLLLGRLSLEGYDVSGIMRPMRDEQVEKIFLKKRQGFGVKTIYSQPRKACVDLTIRALRDNGLVFIPIDQNFGTAGVFVEFFGRQAATATGPIVLAQRTGAALVPCFIIRQPDDTHRIVFEPALKLEEAISPKETIVVNIQKLTNIIEAYIRKYPAEWGWIHRRWKTKPN